MGAEFVRGRDVPESPAMTIAVDLGGKATKLTNKQSTTTNYLYNTESIASVNKIMNNLGLK